MLASMFTQQLRQMEKFSKSVNRLINPSIGIHRMVLAIIFLGLGVLSYQASAQSVSATVTAEACLGQAVTFNVNVSGGTPTRYIYIFSPTDSAIVPSSASSNTRTHLYPAPGAVHLPQVFVEFTNGARVASSSALQTTIYNLPQPLYTTTTQDTQCFRANVFCFDNNSVQNPLAPSNPIVRYEWLYGNGDFAATAGPDPTCINYSFASSFVVTLTAIDAKGCRQSYDNNALPIVVKPNLAVSFDWTRISGPCFTSQFRFNNLTPIQIGNVNSYTWRFGDGRTVTARRPFSAVAIANFSSILHTYATNSSGFLPTLIIEDITGCIDSINYNLTNTSNRLPFNVVFDFDVTTSRPVVAGSYGDSVCIGSRSAGQVCFKQTPVNDNQPGTGDFLWNFDDPQSLTNLNNSNWQPCHPFAGGMNTYYPTLSVRCANLRFTHTYYSAVTIQDDRFLDKFIYGNNDALDANLATRPRPFADTIASRTRVRDAYLLKYTGNFSVAYSDTIYEYAKYYIGEVDSIIERPRFYISTNSLVYNASGGINQVIRLPLDTSGPVIDTNIAKGYAFKVLPFNETPDSFAIASMPTYTTFYNAATKSTDSTANDTVQLKLYGDSRFPLMITKFVEGYPAGYYNYRWDTTGKIVDSTFVTADTTYLQSTRRLRTTVVRLFGYGIRILGPFARIPNPPAGVRIAQGQQYQCGNDTVDFVNTSLYYKSRKVYRLWEMGDDWAPQCTSFSVPKAGWPNLIVSIQPLDSVSYDNGLTWNRFGPDTIRHWRNALEQYRNSNHYFILNGATYPGIMHCQFSFDTLPRHAYPNWDTVYKWHRYGRDFFPWTPADFSLTPTGNQTLVDSGYARWWNKPIFLNPTTGEWSLTQGTGPAPYGLWARIDTMRMGINNNQDLRDSAEITIRQVPDPFALARGQVVNLNGGNVTPGSCVVTYVLDTAVSSRIDTIYNGIGQIVDIDTVFFNPIIDSVRICGFTLLPGSNQTFYEYVFKRTIQRCNTVRLFLKDSSNNESGEEWTLNPDSTIKDSLDCEMEATVQLALVKPDGRGMSKIGSLECPGLSPNVIQFNLDLNPGIMPNCGGQTMFLLNLDSLADRQDGTPCCLDGFTGFQGGVTQGNLNRGTFFNQPNFPNTGVWPNANGRTIVYHYGLGAQGRPAPANFTQGYVTVGTIVGTGCKDSINPNQFLSNLKNNPAPFNVNYDIATNTFTAAGTITAYAKHPDGRTQFIAGLDSTINYGFYQLVNRRAVALVGGGTDTLVDIQYTDCNWPKCISDTVWYHKFLFIQNLAAGFTVEPNNTPFVTCRLRHKGYPGIKEYKDASGNVIYRDSNAYIGEETIVYYADSIQDSIQFDFWDWGDNTVTIDSFWYADNGAQITDGFYTLGMRRVRYNLDITDRNNPTLIDSTVWPINARWPGDTAGLKPGVARDTIFENTLLRDWTLVSPKPPFTAAQATEFAAFKDSLENNRLSLINKNRITPSFGEVVIRQKCAVQCPNNRLPTLPQPVFDTIPWREIYDLYNSWNILNPTYKPDSMIIQRKSTLAIDTIAIRDTASLYLIFQIIDTSMMQLPVSHVFRRTSWEVAGRDLDATTGRISHFINSVKGCSQNASFPVTVGIIDTFDILNSSGVHDTVFCENEEIQFVDSIRYWRFDCTQTDAPNGNPAITKSKAGTFSLGGGPFENLQIDTADFWRQDVGDPSVLQGFNPVLPSPIILINSTTPDPLLVPFDSTQHYFNLNPIPGIPIGLTRWFNGTFAGSPYRGWLQADTTTYRKRLLIDSIVPERVYWDFGDGSPIDSSMRPKHRYASFGTYKVTMATRDSMGFFDTSYRFVYVAKPVAVPKPSQIIFPCGSNVDFIDSSYMIYGNIDPNAKKVDSVKTNYWWFGEDVLDTVNWDTRDQYDPVWRYRRNGTFNIKLVIETHQGCFDTGRVSVFVNGPRPMFRLENVSDTIGCAPFKVRLINMADSLGKYVDPLTGLTNPADTPTGVTFIYWGDAGNQQTRIDGRRDTVEFEYTDSGTFYITALGYDSVPNICAPVLFPDSTFQAKVSITVLKLERNITTDKQVVCVGQAFEIKNLSDTLFLTYDYKAAKKWNGIVTDSVENRIVPDSFNFTLNDTSDYYIFAIPDLLDPFIPINAQPFCRNVDTLEIKVVEASASFVVDTAATPVFSCTNTSDTSINNSYEWRLIRLADNVERQFKLGTNLDPNFGFDLGNDTGSFKICLTAYASGIDQSEGCWDSTCQEIRNTFTTDIDVPNVFSPNSDGKNDFFNILIEGETEYDLVIYNRWGSKVFESTKGDVLWNGKTFNSGADCPAGVYYFIFKYKLRGEEKTTELTGTVTLIR